MLNVPSVLWYCWFGIGKSIRPEKLSDGVLVWSSVWNKVQIICIWSSWCHCHPIIPSSLASFKSRLVLPFWYRLTQVVLEKRPLNGCVVIVELTQSVEVDWNIASDCGLCFVLWQWFSVRAPCSAMSIVCGFHNWTWNTIKIIGSYITRSGADKNNP